MSVKNKIRAMLSIEGYKINELAEYFGISPQAMSNKFFRNSFTADDLIRISVFLGYDLIFKVNENQDILLDASDLDSDN